MKNTELHAAAIASGRMIVAHVGDSAPKRYANDKPGSPQTFIELTRRNGQKTSVIVCEGSDCKSFRIVLDDVIHPIPPGMTLEQAVKRQQAEQSRKLWPDDPDWWIQAPTVQSLVSQKEGAL